MAIGRSSARTSDSTRDRILDALASVVVDQGLHSFSVQDVADQAGISHRTVYRYFPSRDELVEALTSRLDRRMEEYEVPVRPDGSHHLADVVGDVFRIFDEVPDLVSAVAVGSLAAGVQPRTRRARDDAMRAWVAERARGLPEDDVERASAVIRYLANSLSWVVLTRQLDLSSEEAGRAVSWAVRTLLDDLGARARTARGAGDGRGYAAARREEDAS